MFVEIGWDCYQSIQASAGMDLGKVKEKYGKKMALWGGVPVELLVRGTKEEVEAAAEKTMAQGNTHDIDLWTLRTIRYKNSHCSKEVA